MVTMISLDVWKSTGTDFGALFVMISGTWLMLKWSVVNWASEMLARLHALPLMDKDWVLSG